MINLLLGAPGGGKSHEAVVYHILPALKAGRKVITNIPLIKAGFDKIDPTLWALVEIREKSLKVEESGRSLRAFSQVVDYADEWRSAEGHGPLYVVDECHMAMPKLTTPVELEEWYSMHRHYNVDVLLITQSYGKLNINIRDMVQTCYKVRKASALGSNDKYARLVTDGVKGPIMDESVRRYQSQYFQLWRSHTKGRPVGELDQADVASKVQRTKRLAIAVVSFGVIATVYQAVGLFSEKPKPVQVAKPKVVPKPVQAAQVSHSTAPVIEHPKPLPEQKPVEPKSKEVEPFAERGLHLTGCMSDAEKEWCTLTVSQNGIAVFSITNVELERAGYKFQKLTDCVAMATFAGVKRSVICDSPQVNMGIAGASSMGIKPMT